MPRSLALVSGTSRRSSCRIKCSPSLRIVGLIAAFFCPWLGRPQPRSNRFEPPGGSTPVQTADGGAEIGIAIPTASSRSSITLQLGLQPMPGLARLRHPAMSVLWPLSGEKRKWLRHRQTDAIDPIRKCAAPLADRPHARSWGYSAVARGRSEGVVFGSEHVDRGETRLRCDAVPKVNCKADVAGPKGIPSAAND